uniref:1-(5-phosphoribosyl)-5-[(5-phosphoribosylamino)methylideneamino]imidazole-4-carboxamideisomerase n=1 Tax=Arcella intermedia TaxID=1963864 RepID=A0A6B2LF40_9EUKA|eukprot:TRINITY_DN28189_c0_g1_i1.p1 TRINITY_DN28189_c0_g1~~TRINITY_DN28189_c0_g1_i1.p1  ORF type:complete len:254 (+),score=55.03 TRINITY_DN28189_c0_g1_i1:23-784(+)
MFRPCIDLHHGKVKQIVGSTLNVNGDQDQALVTNFESDKDSQYYAQLYKEDGLKGGHVIMLGPGNESAALAALKAYPNGLQVGGGINDKNAHTYLDAGASHIIVTSYVFNNGNIDFSKLKGLVDAVGKERVVLDLSCKKKEDKYYVVTDKWTKFTDFVVNTQNLALLSQYCDEFLVHAVDVEGKCNGILEDLVELLATCPIPVTYAGGIRSINDIKKLLQLGQNKVHYTIGSSLDIYGGSLPYKEVVSWSHSQ